MDVILSIIGASETDVACAGACLPMELDTPLAFSVRVARRETHHPSVDKKNAVIRPKTSDSRLGLLHQGPKYLQNSHVASRGNLRWLMAAEDDWIDYRAESYKIVLYSARATTSCVEMRSDSY